MKELEYWVNYRERLARQLRIFLTLPYVPIPYYKVGMVLDGDYAGKESGTFRDCELLYELPANRGN